VRIEVRGRNREVTDELRRHVEKRFSRIGQQVSEFAVLEVELSEEKNPRIADSEVVDATLHLKTSAARSSAIARSAASATRPGSSWKACGEAPHSLPAELIEPAAGRYPQNPWPRVL
jgi:ribosomal subunit interface protein